MEDMMKKNAINKHPSLGPFTTGKTI